MYIYIILYNTYIYICTVDIHIHYFALFVPRRSVSQVEYTKVYQG